MQYWNTTVQTAPFGMAWRNSVYLRNFCYNRFDLIYSHNYGGTQPDCSAATFGTCGWWGPILEVFPNGSAATPKIKELGFQHAALTYNGAISHLPPSQTYWVSPESPWRLFWWDRNQGYGAGNF